MRVPIQRRKPRRARPLSFPAPTGGWIANRSLAIGRDPRLPPGAAVLDNWFPTSTGILLRRGSERKFQISASGPVLSLFKYSNAGAERVFATVAGDTTIYEVTGSGPSAVGVSTGSGDWIAQQFTTTGGTFLVIVGGGDAMVFNGTAFSPASITFPGGSTLTTADLSYVWVYAGRLWFIQRNSMSVWYLPVGNIAGELTELPLGNSFTLGGQLVWGQSWSLTSGGAGGLSDQCVFASSEGEVVAFQGANPDSALSWSKVGLYRTGKPLGPRAVVRAGGDLLIATSVGLVSLTQASSRDYAALGSSAASYPIEEAWTRSVERGGLGQWSCIIWPEAKMTVVAPARDQDNDPILFVANSNTGAWCRFTAWDVRCMVIHNGILHFGDGSGYLWAANVTGQDDQTPYTGVCIPLFDDMGSPAARKILRNGRVVKRSRYPDREKLTGTFDFDIVPPPPPNPISGLASSLWGTGVWGESIWGYEESEIVTTAWKSLGGSGQDVSICLQVSSGSIYPIDTEIIRVDVTAEICDVIS